MIICNLAVLAASRGISMSTISKETGISRVTLASLAKNKLKGIQMETVDTLCMYFNVKLDTLLSAYPFNVDFGYIEIDPAVNMFTIECYLTTSQRDREPFILYGDYYYKCLGKQVGSIVDADAYKVRLAIDSDVSVKYNNEKDAEKDGYRTEYLFFKNYFSLPENAQSVLAKKITDSISLDECLEIIANEPDGGYISEVSVDFDSSTSAFQKFFNS